MRAFGKEPQSRIKECIQRDFGGEQPIGSAFIVHTGHPDHPFIAHVPVYPNSPETAFVAMRALLCEIEAHNNAAPPALAIRSVVCPGLGTYTGNLHSTEAAQQMAAAWGEFCEAHAGPQTVDPAVQPRVQRAGPQAAGGTQHKLQASTAQVSMAPNPCARVPSAEEPGAEV